MKLIEGTPEEIVQYQRLLGQAHAAVPTSSSEVPSIRLAGDNGEVRPSEQVVVRAFCRLPLSASQRKLLDALLKAGKKGMLTSELAEKVGITRSQLAGVAGAFGRRVANTEGWPKDANLFDSKWDYGVRQWRYILPDVMREVLESGRVKL